MEEELGTVDEQIADYTPLERPSYSNVSNSRFRNNEISDYKSESSSPEDSDTSGSDSPSMKKIRKKSKLKPVNRVNDESFVGKQKKYGVWSMGLQEEALTDGLITSCEVERSFERTRDVESYDFNLPFKLAAENYQPPSPDKANCDDSDINDQITQLNQRPDSSFRDFNRKRSHDSMSDGYRRGYRGRHHHGKRGGKCDSVYKQGSPKILLPLSTTASDNEEDVARDIADKLNEEKENLIVQVVKVLGKEKAIDLFVQTKKIEEDGGMLIVRGNRRRTPGGIFLFILKQDEGISQEDKQSIFADDRRTAVQEKKAASAQRRKLKSEEIMRNLAAADGLPPLSSRKELVPKQEQPMRDEGDQEDVTEEEVVSNPPPSPATDGRENGCADQADEGRALTCYDDYLDLGGVEDVMDLF